MNRMTSKVEIILNNTPFPGAGQEIGGHQVNESMIDVEGKNWAIYLKGKLSQSQVNAALSALTISHHALPIQDEYSLLTFKPRGMLHARTNPPGDVTVVRGHMYYARPNPITSSSFHKEMDEMLINNPEKHFTKYTVRNTKELHERLWKGVSYAGESYGWKKGDDLWHRRASFIMPKIKINKALKGATMFYHTHPSKDEPSLTSADDIQFYLDLHFAWGIKSFYTVMKHKLDHFTITAKKGGKEKYLRMSEDAFIDTVDGMIGKGEEVAKKEVGNDRPEVEFQNRITREMVDLFNKKFKSIAKISFRPKAKNTASKLARKPASNPLTALVNPAPNPPIRVNDQYISKALEELKGLDYAHEHYGADEYGHTMYVYWWLKHHLAPTTTQPKGRLWKLNEYGMDSDTRKKIRAYLSQSIIGNYTYMDAVYLLALYHDIAKLREKGTKQPGWEIGAEMFRKEIGPELNLPSKLTEDLAFLFDTDLGRKGIDDKDFLTQAGDYYGAAKLVQMSDMITHHPTMYKGGDRLKQELMVNMVSEMKDFVDHHYVIQNPPPKVGFIKWVASYGLEDIPKEAAEELLGQFHQSVVPDNDGKTALPGDRSSGGHLYYMRFNPSVLPGVSRYYAANFSLSSSKVVINIGSQVGIPNDLGKKDANVIYQAVGQLLRESYPEIELEEPEPEVIVNPRHANKVQVISLSGPSGGGKSTVLKYLNKHIPNSSIPPTYTTRPKRPSDGKDRVFVSKTEFKEMIQRGEFVEYTVSGNSHYYGRRFKDFMGNVAIVEVTLTGKRHYEKRFDNLFTVYLDPDPSITEEERAKAIFRRGGVSKKEARRRAKLATELVEKSKKMQFDLRVTMMKGKYNEGAKKILSEIPLVNARHTLDVGISQEEQEAANRAREERRAEAAEEAAELAEQFPQDDMDVGITREEQEEADRLLAEDKERIRREEEEAEEERRRYEESLIQDALTITTEEQELEEAYRDLHDDSPWANPKKELFDWFEDWAKLINMKNKELKAFLDSDWGKVAGLSPQEAKKLGINSGRTSGRRILAMRQKLGLGGPKDYIKGPRHLEEMWEVALKKWTGPATKKGTDWYWCTRQVRFNKRFMGDNFGERKGPLVKKQKTQNQPSRRLLSLWVWGHDPWRYARKNGVNRMPKCPDVPWVGMTEKRKYGKIEVIPGPRKNPPSRSDQFTKQDIVWTGSSVKKGLSANLLKAIKSKRHQNREYFGFASKDTLWTHTNFQPRSAGAFESYEDQKKFLEDNEIIFGFHTHPIRYAESVLGRGMQSRWSDVPSPPDYAYHLRLRVIHGVMAEIVSTQHGFFIIEVMEKKSGPKELTQELYDHDIEAAVNAWKGGETTESYVLTPGQHARDTVRAINSKTKFFDFKVSFYDNPVMAVKWKPREDGKFDGNMIKVNPPALSTEVEAHKQVEVQYQGQKFGVDELMAPLLMHLWDNGVHTLFSCQGGDFDDPKWEHWRSQNDPRERVSPDFYEEDGEPGFYNSWTHGYIVIDGGWEYVAYRLRDLLWTEGRMRPSTFNTQNSAYRNGAEIWVESDYHKWGMMTHPKMSMTLQWRGRPDYENLRHIYHAFGLEFPAVKVVRDNAPFMISAPDPEKWGNRYDSITTASLEELQAMVEAKEEELGVTVEASYSHQEFEFKINGRDPLPKINKKILAMIEDWGKTVLSFKIELHKKRASKEDELITDRISPLFTAPFPEEAMDYFRNKKIAGNQVYLSMRSNNLWMELGRWRRPWRNQVLRKTTTFYPSTLLELLTRQSKARYPFTAEAGGGYMLERHKNKGYYGMVKLADAYYHELLGMEDYGMGTSPMRTDMYQSYGWLNAYAYADNTPYFTRAADWYLDATKNKIEKQARYDWIWRPVYSAKSNPHYSPPPGIAMFPGELHQGPAALYQQTISISQLNPPRSKPFPWNKNRVKNSPFKTMKKAQATYDSWKKGNAIGFSANSSLKSMGKIPRASGKYELGEKYERINPPEEHIHWDEYHSHMTDYHVDERQNPAKKACPKPPKKGIIIYGASYCHWCQEAKKHLDEKGKKYKYVDIQEVKDYHKTIYPLTKDYKYIPVIFVDGKFIGGYSELVAKKNPMAPGYQSYGWTTQDWRSIKVNSKGDIDYSEKCGAEGTRTKSGKPRLCLAAPIIRSLMKTESGKEVLRKQAQKKLRAKKGERVPWHPRIKKLHKKLEERTPEDR
ncbi:hypothetical protein N9X64_00390 [bacterium]|nr:hypothetical protein [bacterium]